MASFQRLQTPTIFPGVTEKFVQLTDGRVLVCGVTGSVVMSPDEYGNYSNPTWGEFAPYPGSVFFGALCHVHRDGSVTKWGGHTQNAGDLAYRVIRWDPNTNVWTELANKSNSAMARVPHDFGGFVVELPNGNAARLIGQRAIVLDVSTWQFTEVEASVVWPSQYNPSTPGFAADVLSSVETGWSRLPNDEFVQFSNLGLGLGDPVRFPVHGAWLTRSPMIHASSTIEQRTLYSVADPTFDTAWMHNGTYTVGGAWSPYPTMRQQKISWIHIQGDSNNVSREQSSSIYMPKVDRVMMVGGTAGELFAYNYADQTMSILGQMPQIENLAELGGQMRLADQHVGVSPDTLLRGNAISFVGLSVGSPANWFTLTLSNGRWIHVVSLGGFSGLVGAQYGPGVTFRYVGPFVVVAGENPLTTSAVTTSTVYVSPPVNSAAESPQAILPNGNLLAPVGYGVGVGTFDTGKFAEWDGSNWTLHDAPLSSFSSFVCMLPLPTGQLLTSGSDLPFIMSVDGEPDLSARPIINNAPSVVRPEQTFTIGGLQLHGRHTGVSYGDDWSTNCNLPIVSLTNLETSRVYYCRSTNWTSPSIRPFHPSSVDVAVPASAPAGSYALKVHSAGNISDPVYMRVETITPGPIQVTMLNH